MTAKDVAQALMRLDDGELRGAVITGDVSMLADLELTKEEMSLLRDGLQPPEVTGHAVLEGPFLHMASPYTKTLVSYTQAGLAGNAEALRGFNQWLSRAADGGEFGGGGSSGSW